MKKNLYFLPMNKVKMNVMNMKSFTQKSKNSDTYRIFPTFKALSASHVPWNNEKLILEVKNFLNNTALFMCGVTCQKAI